MIPHNCFIWLHKTSEVVETYLCETIIIVIEQEKIGTFIDEFRNWSSKNFFGGGCTCCVLVFLCTLLVFQFPLHTINVAQ
jgi:hypothetical protein